MFFPLNLLFHCFFRYLQSESPAAAEETKTEEPAAVASTPAETKGTTEESKDTTPAESTLATGEETRQTEEPAAAETQVNVWRLQSCLLVWQQQISLHLHWIA